MEATSPRKPQVLICDDDTTFHLVVKKILKADFDCRSAYNGDEALAIIQNHPIDIVLLDVQMRSADEGLQFIPKLKEADPDLMVVMTSAFTDYPTVREAMKLGATDYLGKSFEPEEIGITLAQILERKSLLQKQEQQTFEALTQHRGRVLIGKSQAMERLGKAIERVRASPANVVILGETGTGKEIVARLLRKTLPDGSLEPFVAIDASTIQSSTAESLLFGHEKGAFTGAEKTTKGLFEEANGGVIYFDEISNMPLAIQAKLLRVIQEKEVVRMGAAKAIKLEFRVICATNRNLDEMVKQGEFKEDLLQRLSVLPVGVPPLRERKEDISVLVDHFLGKQVKLSPQSPKTSPTPFHFTESAFEILEAYDWPGNVRELENLVSYVVAMADQPEIEAADLPPKIREAANRAGKLKAPTEPHGGGGTFYDQIAEVEKKLLTSEYEKHSGNVSKMALALGMDRSHLYTKLKEHGIHPARKA